MTDETFTGWLEMSDAAKRFYEQTALDIARLEEVRASMRALYQAPASPVPQMGVCVCTHGASEHHYRRGACQADASCKCARYASAGMQADADARRPLATAENTATEAGAAKADVTPASTRTQQETK